MRADTYQYREFQSKVRQAESWEHANKLIYQWVKEDRINPAQMSSLTVLAYKHTKVLEEKARNSPKFWYSNTMKNEEYHVIDEGDRDAYLWVVVDSNNDAHF